MNQANSGENSDSLVYDILGFKVKFKPPGSDKNDLPEGVEIKEVVALLQKELDHLSAMLPQVGSTKLAILAALKLASQKIALENEFRTTVLKFETDIVRALQSIEEASPKIQ